MNVVQSGFGFDVMALLVVGAVGYLPFALTYGSSIVSRLYHLYVGLALAVLATMWNMVTMVPASSMMVAVIAAGTGAAFLVLAVRGHRNIQHLLQRVQEQGGVTIGG